MWRDLVKVHPAADLFPMMSRAELEELARDIWDNSLRNGVVFWTPESAMNASHRKLPSEMYLLDGRNRLEAIELSYPDEVERRDALEGFLCIDGESGCASLLYGETDPYSYVVSTNIRRRHLTAEQKREIIAELLRQNPERSDRATAKIASSNPNTVARVRDELEAAGEVSRSDTRVGIDGVAQPAHKPTADIVRMPPPAPQPPRRTVIDVHDANASDKRIDAALRAVKLLSRDELLVFHQSYEDYIAFHNVGSVFDNTKAGGR